MYCVWYVVDDVIVWLCDLSGMAALTDDNLQEISPSAAAASKLLKSGMTLTQVLQLS